MSRMPAWQWGFYQVAMPLSQVLIGLLVLLLAKTPRTPLSLLDGVVLGLFAVGLLSSTVCGFNGPTPAPISKDNMNITWAALLFVIMISTVLTVIYFLNAAVIGQSAFVAIQALLVFIAIPVAWKARP